MDWIGLVKTWTGFVKGGFVKGGFVKHGFVKGAFVKHGFVKTWTDTVLSPRLVFVYEKTCIARKTGCCHRQYLILVWCSVTDKIFKTRS